MKQLLVLGIMVLGINYLNAQTTVFTAPPSSSNNTVNLNTFKYSTCDNPGWIKMGTLTLPQEGNNAFIRLFAGAGYNAVQSQNGRTEIFIRTSNGASAGEGGKYFTAIATNYGQKKLASQIKIVHDNSTDLFDIYVYMGVYNGNGFYTVEAGAGSWVNAISASCSTVSEPTANVYNVPFEFRTQDDTYLASSLFVRKSDGSVGIGINEPDGKLDVNGGKIKVSDYYNSSGIGGAIQIDANGRTGAESKWVIYNMKKNGPSVGAGGLQFWNYPADGTSYGACCNMRLAITEDGNVGIGTMQPLGKLQVVVPNSTAGLQITGSNGYETWFPYSDGNNYIRGNTIISDLGGTVLIGTNTFPAPSASYKMVVDGKVGVRKLVVTQLAGWADYVFVPSYKLRPLQDLETYIKQHQHLPDVPSASEVAANGIDLGDNQAVLLKKIEELTLYVIEQNKELQMQKKEIQLLKKTRGQ
ncbi:MAG: hypothetical protein QM541_08260 [Flavobacterium sp.]|nr:hypothetical protein [Flavobacterium sp.]